MSLFYFRYDDICRYLYLWKLRKGENASFDRIQRVVDTTKFGDLLSNVVAIRGAAVIYETDGGLRLACTYTQSLTNEIRGKVHTGLIPFYAILDDIHQFTENLLVTTDAVQVVELVNSCETNGQNISRKRLIRAYQHAVEPIVVVNNNCAEFVEESESEKTEYISFI